MDLEYKKQREKKKNPDNVLNGKYLFGSLQENLLSKVFESCRTRVDYHGTSVLFAGTRPILNSATKNDSNSRVGFWLGKNFGQLWLLWPFLRTEVILFLRTRA